jgi:hypothetical protein
MSGVGVNKRTIAQTFQAQKQLRIRHRNTWLIEEERNEFSLKAEGQDGGLKRGNTTLISFKRREITDKK